MLDTKAPPVRTTTTTGRRARRDVGLPLLLGALLVSGAAGLTYQVLWLRLLSLVFGVTAYAASTVLAGFMAGLALGSVLAGRIASRTTRPLALFAAAEAGIAATGLLSPLLPGALPAIARTVHAVAGDDFAALTAVRFLTAFLLLLIPTTFMGATLPLVVASPIVRSGRTASRISAVYATNTAGAIGGALLTGFVLVGAIGMRNTFLLAAGCNLVAAAVALALSRRLEGDDRMAASVAPGRHASLPDPRPVDAAGPVRRAVLAVMALSGLASLALEVIWFRILVLFVPATTYAFTTMLAAVLGGIAAGSWIAARLLRKERDWLALLLTLQAATAILVVASMAALGWTYAAGWRTSGTIQASILAILPASLLMGIAFPVALRLWATLDRRPDGLTTSEVARDVGSVYAVNVCGAIAGALLGGFLLLPWLGSRTSLIVSASLFLVSALVLALARGGRRAFVSPLVALLLFAAFVKVLPDPFAVTLERRHGPADRLFWREEGVQTTVSVHVQPFGRHVLFLDGLHQANDSPEMLRIHREIGHLPMVLHPDPRDVLVIGLGGGATAGAVSQHTRADIEIVELSDSVRKGAAFFGHANYDVLRQPHVTLRVDDGRNFLQRGARRYDVITADIIQPIHAGAGLLYSLEYFTLAREALKEDGLMLQWVGHRPDTQYRLIVRTFLRAFPHATLWKDGTLLVGSRRPLVVSRAAFEARLADPVTRAALAEVGLDSFGALLSWYRAGAKSLDAFIGPGEVLTDDRPRLEYHRSLPREEGVVDLSPLQRDLDEIRVRD